MLAKRKKVKVILKATWKKFISFDSNCKLWFFKLKIFILCLYWKLRNRKGDTMQHAIQISLWRRCHCILPWGFLFLWVLVSFQYQHDTGSGECPVCPLSLSPVSTKCWGKAPCVYPMPGSQYQLEPGPGLKFRLSSELLWDSRVFFILYLNTFSNIFQKACWGSSYCRLGLLIHAIIFFSFHCQLQMFFLSFSLGKLRTSFTIMLCYHFICNGLFLRQLQHVSLLWFWQNYAFSQQYFWYKHSLSSKKSLLLSCVKDFVSCVSNVNLLSSITTLTVETQIIHHLNKLLFGKFMVLLNIIVSKLLGLVASVSYFGSAQCNSQIIELLCTSLSVPIFHCQGSVLIFCLCRTISVAVWLRIEYTLISFSE